MDIEFLTDVGQLREHNEDAGGIFVNKAGEYLAIVADGMGGHQAGDVASEMTVDLLRQSWESIEEALSPETAGQWLSDHINKVNRTLYQSSVENTNLQGMGTTVVAAVCAPSFIAIAHVGDSRAYFLSEEGDLRLKTEDHSLVNELRKNGQLTEEEAENHPRKNILTRALGTESQIKSETIVMEWKEGEGIVLCSDGLTNKLSDSEIKETLFQDVSLKERTKKLVHIANERGGEDNITIAVVLHSPSEKGMM